MSDSDAEPRIHELCSVGVIFQVAPTRPRVDIGSTQDTDPLTLYQVSPVHWISWSSENGENVLFGYFSLDYSSGAFQAPRNGRNAGDGRTIEIKSPVSRHEKIEVGLGIDPSPSDTIRHPVWQIRKPTPA